MEGAFLLNVIVTQSSAVFQLFSGEDESLLIGGNTFLVLNLGLDIINGVAGFNIKSDGLASQGLDENLHTTSQSEDQMEGAFLLNVIVA